MATALNTPGPSALVSAKVKLMKVIQDGVRAIQRKPRTSLSQRVPAGLTGIATLGAGKGPF